MARTWRTAQRVAVAILFVVILACYVANGLQAVRANTNSSDFDQRSYLGLAIDIKDGDRLTDGNRHPLFPALLAPFAEREWAFYTVAKLISLGLGVLTLLLIYGLVKRRCRAEVGLIVMLLVSQNPAFLRVTSHVMSESLLVPLFVLAWYLTDRGLDGACGEARPRVRYLLAAGAVTGLVYLTKGTGQLLVMIFIPVALFTYRRHLSRLWPSILAYIGAYSLVASPLWVYNQRRYGNPFYNYNTTHTFWFDAWEDKYASGELPTWLSYLRSHSLGEIISRQWQGMGAVLPSWGEAIFPSSAWFVLLAALALLLLSAWITAGGEERAWRPRPSLLFDGVLIGLHYLLFAWYAQVYVAPRFLLPLTPALCLFGVCGIRWAAKRLPQRLPAAGARSRNILQGAYVGLFLALSIGLCADTAGALRTIATNPFASDREHNAESDAMFAWVQSNLTVDPARTGEELDFLWGPSTTFGSWRYEPPYDFKEIPSDLDSWADLEAFVADKELDYALIDAHTVQRRQALLSPYFAVDGDRVEVLEMPSNWALTYVEPGLPARWCLFQFLEREPIQNPLPLTFGDSIRLLGYDVAESDLQEGGSLHFTLYWQALAPIGEDYTVFTHLLGADSSLVSQIDGAPLQGRVPTSSWQPGAVYADRYEMSIPEGAPQGEAQLEIGLYLYATMERLPIADEGGRSLTDDRVLLPASLTISAPSL